MGPSRQPVQCPRYLCPAPLPPCFRTWIISTTSGSVSFRAPRLSLFSFLVFLLGLALGTLRGRPALSFGILWFFVTLSVGVVGHTAQGRPGGAPSPIWPSCFPLYFCGFLFGFGSPPPVLGRRFPRLSRRRPRVGGHGEESCLAKCRVPVAGRPVQVAPQCPGHDPSRERPWTGDGTARPGVLFHDLERWPGSGRPVLPASLPPGGGSLARRKRSRGSPRSGKERRGTPGSLPAAAACRKRGNVDKALDVYREGLTNPRNAEIHVLLGKLLRESGKMDEAMSQLSETVRGFRSTSGARDALGVFSGGSPFRWGAEREFRRLVERIPEAQRHGRGWEVPAPPGPLRRGGRSPAAVKARPPGMGSPSSFWP